MISFDECKRKGKIIRFRSGKSLFEKEFVTAKEDFATAKKSLRGKNYKWAIIQGYYSIFHSARALLYQKDFNEHSHICLFVAILNLYKGQLDDGDFERFKRAKSLREGADYDFKSDKKSAEFVVSFAKEFLAKSAKLLDLG
jgi:uncharacterized protein (UPF0332 family)